MTDPTYYQPLNDDTATYEVHPVGTAAELASLRALKARVEDDELIDDVVARGMQGNGHPTNCVCHTCAEDCARERGAADYRAALRVEKGGGA